MIGLVLALLGSVAQAACPGFEAGAQDAAFEVAVAEGARLVLELRLGVDSDAEPAAGLVEPLIRVASQQGVPLVLLASPGWAEAHSDLLRRATAEGHELALLFIPSRELGMSPATVEKQTYSRWWAAIKAARKRVRSAGGAPVHAIALDQRNRAAEVAAEELHFRVLLPLDTTEGGLPSRVAPYAGVQARARIIPEGVYGDGCGADLPGWTPAAFDRAAHAAGQYPVVRMGLPAVSGAQPVLLDRWLQTLPSPSRQVHTATAIGRLPANVLRIGEKKPTTEVRTTALRRIDRAAWTGAAQQVVASHTLPHSLTGGLNPTESFLALATVLAVEHTPTQLTLGTLAAPVEIAQSAMPDGGWLLQAAAVKAAAADLLPGLSRRVPAVVSVSGHTLTAAEFLLAMALTAQDLPVQLRRISDPDPFAPGGGWGTSG